MRKSFTLFMLMLMAHITFANAADVILSADFNNGYTTEGWIAHDTNGDGVSWSITDQLNGYVYNGINTTQDANDWLFTPAFEVKTDKHYLLTYTVAQRGAYNSDFITISYGQEAQPQSMNDIIVEDEYNMHGGMITRNRRISFPEDGTYVLGIKLTSPSDNGIVSIKSLSIVESQPCTPQAVPAMVANMDADNQTVKLKWVNPRKDIENVYITNKMNALVYEDNTLVETLEDVVPGNVQEFNFKPATFSGKHDISVSVVVDGLESEKTSKTLNYDDINGSLQAIYTFPLQSKSDFELWKVSNFDNDNYKWQYYSRTAYISGFDKNTNDWLITPGCELEANKRYVLTYELASGRDFPASLDVTMGNEQNSTSQTTILASYRELYQNGFALYESPQFEVESTGSYYFGFHALYVSNSLDLKNVTINIVNAGGSSQEEELVWEEPEEEILPDNINGDLNFQEPYHQRLSSECVELYAAYTYALIDEYTLAPEGIYHLTSGESGYAVDFNNPEASMLISGGAVYHDGKIYCNEYDASGNYQEAYPIWKILDANTFEVISQTTLNNNCENTTVAMAYDATTNKIYGLVKDYVDSYLVEIDPATGAMARIGDRLDYHYRFTTIGCNVQGQLYCIYMTEDNIDGTQTQYLARINKQTGDIATIGQITGVNMMPGDMPINMKMRQALFFNNQTGKMYWYLCSSSSALGSQYGAIFEVNTINANAALQTWRTDIFAISGAFFAEPLMQAPDIITNVNYTPEQIGSLNGVINFTLPEKTYSLEPLSGTIGYKILMASDRSLLYTGEGQPGETITINHTAEEGIYDVLFIAYNDKGESAVKKYSILVGYDLPGPPENLLLTDDGFTTTVLTWDAPITGIHNQAYDKSRLTYNVYRYPDDALIASGLTETRFVDTHGDEMTLYKYIVFSCNDGEQTLGRRSNEIVIGAPLSVPYGGVFAEANDMYNYYTILDENDDYYTWTYDSSTGAAFYPYNYQLHADDWMISPPIRYYEGDVYTLQFSAFSLSEEYPESLLVTFGSGKNPYSQSTILLDLPELPTIDENDNINVYSIDITVPLSGVYYYGFKAYSPEWSSYLYLYDISMKLKSSGAVNEVQSYNRDFDAYYYNGGISVINPNAHDIAIYNVNGVLMHRSNETQYNVTLTPGVYMVRSAQSVVKIVVR